MWLRVVVLEDVEPKKRQPFAQAEKAYDFEAASFEVTPIGALLLFRGPASGTCLFQAYAPGRWSRVYEVPSKSE